MTSRFHLLFLSLSLLLIPGFAQEGDPLNRPISRLPLGADLLKQVQQGLPPEHMRFNVTMKGKNLEGEKVDFDSIIDVDWGAKQPNATYIIERDGQVEEGLNVTWVPNEKPVIVYERNGEEQADFRITDKVQGLELTWADLTLSFIWWEGAKTIKGGFKKLGRTCYLVEVPAPEWERHLFSKAHLWIDDQARMVLQAQTFDTEGRPLRYFDVDSIAEYAPEQWMAKELEFATLKGSSKKHKIKVAFDLESVTKL